MAGDTRLLMVSQFISGTWAEGSSLLMEKRSPMVSMLSTPANCLSNNAMTVIKMMATREPGIFLLNFGVTAMTTTLTMPMRAHHGSIVPKHWKYTPHFSRKSDGLEVNVSPKRSFICVVKMVTAIPLVKPTTMG